MAKPKIKPVKEFRSHGVKAAVWRREKETDDGRKYFEYSVTVSKSYKDANGDWQETDTYFPNELSVLKIVVSEALRYIMLGDANDN